jgi:streptomycin 6-kinase
LKADLFQPWLTRWRLVPDGEAFTTSTSRLLLVRRGGEAAMLKIAVTEEERRGAAFMTWYAGEGAAKVYAHEDDALLLERADGSSNLKDWARTGRDDDATKILCQTVQRLHAPRAAPYPQTLVPLQVWFRALEPATQRHGGILTKALAASRDLLSAPRQVVALHGDIHHGNVLSSTERGWLAIDPKGLLGERGFDYANIFCNPDHDIAAAPGRLERQAALVAKLAGLDLARLKTWILAYAGLSAAWNLEEGEDPTSSLAIAEIAALHSSP